MNRAERIGRPRAAHVGELSAMQKGSWSVGALLIALAFAAGIGCQKPDKRHVSESASAPVAAQTDRDPDRIGYVEMLTAGARAKEPLPLIMAVHGLGGKPESLRRLFEKLPVPTRVVLPRAPIGWGKGFAWFETRIASGDFKALSDGIARSARKNAELLDYLLKRRAVRGRPIFLGFSQGGMISFAIAVYHPENIGLVIPISGFLPKPLWPKEKKQAVKHPRVRALHGAQDGLVKIGPTREAVEHLRALGYDVELKEFPRARHTVSQEMRQELYRLIGEEINQM